MARARQHGDAVGVVVVGNALENKETTGAFDQGDDRRPVGRPHDQVALPVPWHRPVGGLGRPVGSGSCPGSPPARWSSPAADPGSPEPCHRGAGSRSDALRAVRGPGSTGLGSGSLRPTPASSTGQGARAPGRPLIRVWRPALFQPIGHRTGQLRAGLHLARFGSGALLHGPAAGAARARQTSRPPHRAISLLITEPSRPSNRPIARPDNPAARPREISSRSPALNATPRTRTIPSPRTTHPTPARH